MTDEEGSLFQIGIYVLYFTLGANYSSGYIFLNCMVYAAYTLQLPIHIAYPILLSGLTLVLENLMTTVGFILTPKVDNWLLIILGCTIHTSCVFFASLIVSYSALGVLVLYGVCKTIGVGLALGAVNASIPKRFSEKQKYFLAICRLCIGEAFFVMLQSVYMRKSADWKISNISSIDVKDFYTALELGSNSSTIITNMDAIPRVFLIEGIVLIPFQIVGILLCYGPRIFSSQKCVARKEISNDMCMVELKNDKPDPCIDLMAGITGPTPSMMFQTVGLASASSSVVAADKLFNDDFNAAFKKIKSQIDGALGQHATSDLSPVEEDQVANDHPRQPQETGSKANEQPRDWEQFNFVRTSIFWLRWAVNALISIPTVILLSRYPILVDRSLHTITLLYAAYPAACMYGLFFMLTHLKYSMNVKKMMCASLAIWFILFFAMAHLHLIKREVSGPLNLLCFSMCCAVWGFIAEHWDEFAHCSLKFSKQLINRILLWTALIPGLCISLSIAAGLPIQHVVQAEFYTCASASLGALVLLLFLRENETQNASTAEGRGCPIRERLPTR